MTHHRSAALGLSAALALAYVFACAACDNSDAADISYLYQICDGVEGAPCVGGSQCLSTVEGTQLCTEECRQTSDCPLLPGFEVSCVTFVEGRLCAPTCGGGSCPYGQTCTGFSSIDGQEVALCN